MEKPRETQLIADPITLADKLVLELESFASGNEITRDTVTNGVSLLDYLIGLADSGAEKVAKESSVRFSSFESDKKVFKQNEISKDSLLLIRSFLTKLLEMPNEVDKRDIPKMQRLLLVSTMPFWQDHNVELYVKGFQRKGYM
jgi:hypothetical protein